jgi:hypothetical protein
MSNTSDFFRKFQPLFETKEDKQIGKMEKELKTFPSSSPTAKSIRKDIEDLTDKTDKNSEDFQDTKYPVEETLEGTSGNKPKRFEISYTLKNGEKKKKIMIGRDKARVKAHFEYAYRHKADDIRELARVDGQDVYVFDKDLPVEESKQEENIMDIKNTKPTAAEFFRKYSDIITEAEKSLEEAPKCPICHKPMKENTADDPKYCQGHD